MKAQNVMEGEAETVVVAEEEESVDVEGEEEMAFNGAFTPKTETMFSVHNATVNGSTLLVMYIMAMVVMIGKNCFWKSYHRKTAKRALAVHYGTV